MFRIYLTNMGYFMKRQFATLDEAFMRARQVCFECSIWRDKELVGTWSPLRGGWDIEKQEVW